MDTGMGWGIVLSMVAFVLIVMSIVIFPLQALIILFVAIFGSFIKAFAKGFMDGMK